MYPPQVVAFLLIRHAQSTWNAAGRWQGQADLPLSDSGTASAVEAAARLACEPPFDLVITSDLTRARRTGEILGAVGEAPPPPEPGSGCGPAASTGNRPGPPPAADTVFDTSGTALIVEPALRELHVGEWSGLTRSEIEQRWPYELDLFDTGRLSAPPGGETREEFDSRVREAAREVARHIYRRGARRTLVVTHGGVIRSLLRSGGLLERHVTNLAGYEGRSSTESLSLEVPVDLLQPAARALSDGPAIL